MASDQPREGLLGSVDSKDDILFVSEASHLSPWLLFVSLSAAAVMFVELSGLIFSCLLLDLLWILILGWSGTRSQGLTGSAIVCWTSLTSLTSSCTLLLLVGGGGGAGPEVMFVIDEESETWELMEVSISSSPFFSVNIDWLIFRIMSFISFLVSSFSKFSSKISDTRLFSFLLILDGNSLTLRLE